MSRGGETYIDSKYPSEETQMGLINGMWEDGLWEVRELNESRFQ